MDSPVQGFWTLQSWQKVKQDGSLQPYSPEEIGGFLYYSPEGQMAVSIYERQAPRLLSSYAGRYEFSGDEVIHQPFEGSSPNGIREKKVRRVQLHEGHMIMETKWNDPSNPDYIHRLVWLKRQAKES